MIIMLRVAQCPVRAPAREQGPEGKVRGRAPIALHSSAGRPRADGACSRTSVRDIAIAKVQEAVNDRVSSSSRAPGLCRCGPEISVELK